jgi:hypothetical protein
MSNKSLLILFAILLLAFGFYLWQESRTEERTFKKELVSFDPTKITSVEVVNPETGTTVFTNQENDWKVKLFDGRDDNAKDDVVARMIQELSKIKPERVVAVDDKKWEELKVADGKGIRVMLKEGEKPVLDIYLGKFNMTGNPQQMQPGMNGMPGQQQPQFSNYVRLAGDKETYETKGMLEMLFRIDPKMVVDTTLNLGTAPIPAPSNDPNANIQTMPQTIPVQNNP